MSNDQLALPALRTLDVALPTGSRPATNTSPPCDDEDLPRVVILATVASDTVDTLLLHVAHGDHDAFLTLQERMSGLMLLNIRRVLRDATRSRTVIQATFDDLLHDSLDFDPLHDDAQTWLLTRAHQHATNDLNAITATSTDLTIDPHDPATDQPMSLAH
jgi:hypothetical protein